MSGWAVLALALISPLCPLSVALFSARASQHVAITMIAAPLIAAAFARAISVRSAHRLAALALIDSPIVAAFVFAAILWFWHAPAPYALTFDSVAAYWTMHVTMIASAVWLWYRLIDDGARPIEALIASLVSTVQMGFLGALITLAPHPLYAPHFATTPAWNLTPLEDQALGGAIMWVLGCIAFLAMAMTALSRLLRSRTPVADVIAARLRHRH